MRQPIQISLDLGIGLVSPLGYSVIGFARRFGTLEILADPQECAGGFVPYHDPAFPSIGPAAS